MNNTPTATVGIRIFGAISYSLLSANGLTLNILLVWVLLRSKWTFQKVAFYSITFQLIICDLGTHSMEFIVPIPLTSAGFDLYGQSLFLYIPCFIDTVVYCGTVLFSFLVWPFDSTMHMQKIQMTINRITVFTSPRINNFLFQQKLWVTIGFVWAFDILFVICLNYFACYKTFNSSGFYYHHVCPDWQENKTIGYYLFQGFFQTSGYLPLIMLICWIVMIILIKFKLEYEIRNGRIVKRSTNTPNSNLKTKKEFSLLAQGFIICGCLELQKIAFNVIPQIPVKDQWIFVINFAGNWVSLLLSSIHPIVLFTFNRDIRRRLKSLLNLTFLVDSGEIIVPVSVSVHSNVGTRIR